MERHTHGLSDGGVALSFPKCKFNRVDHFFKLFACMSAGLKIWNR